MLTTLLFTLPPLLSIRKVRPSMILRRDMAEARPPVAQAPGCLASIAGCGRRDSARHRRDRAWLAESPKSARISRVD
jgi:hypothetical protein